MEATVDANGRIVLPKPLRDKLRLAPGTEVDVTEYGDGLHVAPMGRTARLEERDGHLVAASNTLLTDEAVLAVIDAGRNVDAERRLELVALLGDEGRFAFDQVVEAWGADE